MPIHSLRRPVTSEANISESDEGDVVRRLRMKNRKLEQELASFVNQREEVYAKMVAQAEEKCLRLLREKDCAHASARELHKKDVEQTRAGATIMCSLFMANKARLKAKIKADTTKFESQLAAERQRFQQLEAEYIPTTRALQQQLAKTVQEYEAKLAQQEVAAEEKMAQLERQLSAVRHEAQVSKEKLAQQHRDAEDLRQQLQQRLVDMERLEGLVAAPRMMIKEIQNKARLQKEGLEKEIADYVRFIVAAHRVGEMAPTTNSPFPARCFIAARPTTAPTPPKVLQPLQEPASARSPPRTPVVLEPLPDLAGVRSPPPHTAPARLNDEHGDGNIHGNSAGGRMWTHFGNEGRGRH